MTDRNELKLSGTVSKPPIYNIGKSGKAYGYLHLMIVQGEHKTFLSVSVFGDIADNLLENIKEGDHVEVEGYISPSKYERGGKTVYSYNLVATSIKSNG